MTYYLGIDGGGTKTDFVVADEKLQIIKKVHLQRGTNPWQYGLPTVLSVLNQGLNQLEPYKNDVHGLVAGISGCFLENQFSADILHCLQQYCSNARLVGDLPISFRAVTDQKTGIIAIAGTGSSVTQFFSNDSHYLYDGIGCGGRDIGFWYAQAYRRNQLGQEGAAFLRSVAPVLESGRLHTTADYYNDSTLQNLPYHISQLDADSIAFQDLKQVIDMVADRWRFKLYGIITKFLYKVPDQTTVTLVLNGSLWKFDYFRRQVTESLAEEFPQLALLYDPQAEPVFGALRMARDQFTY